MHSCNEDGSGSDYTLGNRAPGKVIAYAEGNGERPAGSLTDEPSCVSENPEASPVSAQLRIVVDEPFDFNATSLKNVGYYLSMSTGAIYDR
jgi:hypothetical protein